MTTAVESLVISSDGLRLFGGRCLPQEPRGVAVFLHGIPSIAPPDPDDAGYAGLAMRFAQRGWAGMWADMRGARRSEGYFSIEGWVHDAAAIVETARGTEGASSQPLALVGSSAGGAVAAELTRRGAPVDALVLLAAPATWQGFAADPAAGARRVQEDAGMAISVDEARDLQAWAEQFLRVTAEEAIGDIKLPTLIVHGTADETVPVDHARRLAARAPDAELVILEGAPHQLRRHDEAVEIVLAWLDRVLP